MRGLSLVPAACGALVLATGVAVLLGWLFDIATLKSVWPGLVTMKANTALGFLLAGAALMLLAPRRSVRYWTAAGRLFAAAAALLGLLTLTQYAAGFDLRIDELIFADDELPRAYTAVAGRMALSTAVAFILAGGGLLLLERGPRHWLQGPEAGAVGILALVSVTIIQYVFDRAVGYQPLDDTRMAVHTVTAFTVLAGGLLALRPERGALGAVRERITGALEWRVYGALAVSLLVLLVAGAAAYLSAQDEQQRSAAVEQSQEVRRALALMLSKHKDLETGERGYVITGRPDFLAPFEEARREADAVYVELLRVAGNDPETLMRLYILDQLRRGHLDWTLRVVDARRRHGAAAAVDLIATGRGKGYLDALRTRIAGLDEDAVALQRQAQAAARASADRLNATLTLSTVLGLLIVTFAGVAIHRDFGRRQQAEQVIREQNALLEQRVLERTAELTRAEARLLSQVEHLSLLDRITRGIAERLDLDSVFQVVIRSIEESLPIDFGAVFLHDPVADTLVARSVGGRSATLSQALTAGGTIRVDANGLARCMRGDLVYEPDIAGTQFPFAQRLTQAGLRSLVLAPLRSESRVFGVLAAARREPAAFESVECEFLRQLSEHVALAAQQARLYGSLQEAYDELRETQAAMIQEERLRALGQMASGIAHDINNALSPVSLYTDALLDGERGLSPRGRGYLETIRRSLEDVAKTVARMREFYRKRERESDLAPVDVNLMVQQVLELTRARWSDMALGRGVTIEAHAEPAADLPAIMGVESEIREALTNLVFNAVDAMPQGGTLVLRTRLTGQAAERAVAVEVIDTGIGMDEETRRRCLEPFYTTKGERGTGLGLAMVFGMVQRHGCGLELDSAPGRGTTMRLVFKVPGALPGSVAAREGGARPLAGLRLLLVDDDPVLLKSLRDALESDGHAIVAANGGHAGITEFHAAQQSGAGYAAVLTDLGMPHVDGRQVASAVKAVSPETPVIMLTGWGQRLVADDEIPPHVDRVLPKPPRLAEVRAALAELCGRTMALKGAA